MCVKTPLNHKREKPTIAINSKEKAKTKSVFIIMPAIISPRVLE